MRSVRTRRRRGRTPTATTSPTASSGKFRRNFPPPGPFGRSPIMGPSDGNAQRLCRWARRKAVAKPLAGPPAGTTPGWGWGPILAPPKGLGAFGPALSPQPEEPGGTEGRFGRRPIESHEWDSKARDGRMAVSCRRLWRRCNTCVTLGAREPFGRASE